MLFKTEIMHVVQLDKYYNSLNVSGPSKIAAAGRFVCVPKMIRKWFIISEIGAFYLGITRRDTI